MHRSHRGLLLPALAACLAAFVMAWMELLTPAFSDYEVEAQPAFDHLRSGDLAGFLHHLPLYGGSLIVRAPFAMLPSLWGGGELAVFRAVAVPCLALVVLLGVVLFDRAAARGRGPLFCWVTLALCAANPLTLRALEPGHAEELLVGVLCVAAALCARSGRALPAGLLVGLAAGCKPWAIVAVAPVLVSLPSGRGRAAAGALAGAVLVGAPVLLGAAPGTASAAPTGAIFKPFQLWWLLGHHVAPTPDYPLPGSRRPPSWLGQAAHPAIVVATLALTLAWARRTAGRPERRDVLLMLTLVLLLRCMLDPWNIPYYELPFALALTAWEVHERATPLPWLALAATALAWTSMTILPSHLSPDALNVAYLAWTVPLAAALGLRLFDARALARLTRPLAALAQRHLPTLTAGRTA
jgi:hypothetical protein